jgi:hypothetical protein
MNSSKHTTANPGASIQIDVVPKQDSYMTIDVHAIDHDTLLDALKYSATRNKEICDEIIAKQNAFEAQHKPVKKKK